MALTCLGFYLSVFFAISIHRKAEEWECNTFYVLFSCDSKVKECETIYRNAFICIASGNENSVKEFWNELVSAQIGKKTFPGM